MNEEEFADVLLEDEVELVDMKHLSSEVHLSLARCQGRGGAP